MEHWEGFLGRLENHHRLWLNLFLLQRSPPGGARCPSATAGGGPEENIPQMDPRGGWWLAGLESHPPPQLRQLGAVFPLNVRIWEEKHILPRAFFQLGFTGWAHPCHNTPPKWVTTACKSRSQNRGDTRVEPSRSRGGIGPTKLVPHPQGQSWLQNPGVQKCPCRPHASIYLSIYLSI